MSKTVRKNPLHLPALRCRMGDRGFLVTAMRFREVAERVKGVPEVHSSIKLRDWIQRELNTTHAKAISDYLKQEPEKFFNAMVIGVYGGDPQWSPLKVSDPRNELSEEDEERLGESIGILTLTGKEMLFPIDGQHRVAGIKKAVKDEENLADEEVTVVLVGHARTEDGMRRTRRLFVTLNQRAKKVSDRDIVALDEDNGLAVITRQMIDEFQLFQRKGLISFSGNVAILDSDQNAVTSVLGLFQIVKGLYPRKHDSWPKISAVRRTRPEPNALSAMFEFYTTYWDTLVERVPEYKAVLRDGKRSSSDFRKPTKNHLLFRPAGQLAFARATECLMSRHQSMKDAVDELYEANTPWLNDTKWHHILWDPVNKKMLNNWSVAETVLLTSANQAARTTAADTKLSRIRKESQSE